MTRPTLIDLNPVEPNYYPFIISFDKCNGNFDAADDVSMKNCVPSDKMDVNVKVFNMIIKTYEAKHF